MNPLKVQTTKFKNAKFPDFMKEVVTLKTKEEADSFFLENEYEGYTFVSSEVNSKGNYILEINKRIGLNIEEREKQITVLNFGLCLQGGDGKNIIFEFTDNFYGGKTVL